MAGAGALAGGDVTALIDRLARTSDLGIFVGAGLSVEAGLPSWSALLRRLLNEISIETAPFRKAKAGGLDTLSSLQAEFATRSLSALGPLGAGGVIKVHFGEAYRTKLTQALYQGVELLSPGPTAISIARFVVGYKVEDLPPILTTNFDPLLEMALREELSQRGGDPDRVRTHLPGEILDQSKINVVHLHGVVNHPSLDYTDSQEIVFSEDEFLNPGPMGNSALELAQKSLASSPYLFLGAGLTDTNILGDLYKHHPDGRSSRHAAVAVSQQAAMDLDPDAAEAVVEALQETAAGRLRNADVDVVFVDTYSEASQFMRELNLQRGAVISSNAATYATSAHSWSQRAHRFEQHALATGLLPCQERSREFRKLQKPLRHILDGTATQLKDLFSSLPSFRNDDEHLALHLWVHAPIEQVLSMVGQSDRRLYNPATPQAARATLPTDYLVVEALCNGTVVEAKGEGLRSSRWGSMVAVPFTVAEDKEAIGDLLAPLPAGVLVLASTNLAEDGLARLHSRPDERTQLIAALAELGSRVIQTIVEGAPERDPRAPDFHHLEPRGIPLGRAGRHEFGSRRIGEATEVGGAPGELVDLGRWKALLPTDLDQRLRL